MTTISDLKRYCQSACVNLWGEPDQRTKRELRWNGGDSYGYRSFNLRKRSWYDAGAQLGGSTLQLAAYALGKVTKPLRGPDLIAAWQFAFDQKWIPDPPPQKKNGGGRPVIATYPYHDENAALLFEVVRFDTSDPEERFRQRQPDGKGNWIWNIKGVRRVLYRLPQLIAAVKAGERVLVSEGEKDANTAVKLGYAATTMPGGIGKWRGEYDEFFRNADVVVVSDNDPQLKDPKTGGPQFHPDGKPKLPGQDHAAKLAKRLSKVAQRVRVIMFPVKDLSDWVAGGGNHEQLDEMIEQTLAIEAKTLDEVTEAKTESAGLEDSVALAFAGQHADQLRYVAKSSQWMRWDGLRWQVEDTLAAFDSSRMLCRAAGDAKAKTVAAVVTLARSDRRLAAKLDQWDGHAMLFNTTRGTIDLVTGIERAPDRNDYITKRAGTWLAERGTPHPLWTNFLDLVTEADETLIGFLQRLAGYCLTGLVREHVLAFLYGLGRNGKGVFVGTLAKIMNDYAIIAPIEMFLASKHERHPTEIARLKGARLVIAQETQKGRRWDETKLKVLTGGDRLSGHFMRQDYFDFDPTHKIIVTGNHKPSLSAVNEAIRQRVLLTPFSVVIPVEQQDPDFGAKLIPELPAILRWAVDGCLEWQRDGLSVPGRVRQASEQYFANQDSLEQWLADCVDDRDPRVFTTTRVLFTSWKTWSEQRGMRPGSEKDFVESLADKGHEQHRLNYGRGFKGLALHPDDLGPSPDKGW
jgi:putative DNA primase/helicase